MLLLMPLCTLKKNYIYTEKLHHLLSIFAYSLMHRICIVYATKWDGVLSDRCHIQFVLCHKCGASSVLWGRHDLRLTLHCIEVGTWAWWQNSMSLTLLQWWFLQASLSWSYSVSSNRSHTHKISLCLVWSIWQQGASCWLTGRPAGADVAFMSYGSLRNCHIPTSKYCSCQQPTGNYGCEFAIFPTAQICP